MQESCRVPSLSQDQRFLRLQTTATSPSYRPSFATSACVKHPLWQNSSCNGAISTCLPSTTHETLTSIGPQPCCKIAPRWSAKGSWVSTRTAVCVGPDLQGVYLRCSIPNCHPDPLGRFPTASRDKSMRQSS
ncbi:uncharacterized protein LOC107054988 [Gallus gallus]|uniref:uncharacterized protein LOC107054988 n=1 Tax=Gallus gallus TaxID=9031 RepID=UPI001EFFC5F1|nr:uncharacterized protein LOC107054988 [Gallus gallus]